MAFTTPGTAVAGEVLTAAFWNEQVRDNLTELAPTYIEILNGTPQTGIVTATVTKVNQTGATVTNPGGWTVSDWDITVPGATLPGVYLLSGQVCWDDNSTGTRALMISDGSPALFYANAGGMTSNSPVRARISVSGLRLITTDRTFSMLVLQNSGNNRALSNNGGDIFFSIARVAPIA